MAFNLSNLGIKINQVQRDNIEEQILSFCINQVDNGKSHISSQLLLANKNKLNNDLIEKIVNITDIKDANILEIGPGTGNLTSAILKKKPNKLIVVEKDDVLAEQLKIKFNEEIKVINDDILKINEKKILNKKLTVFGNLPYNISTEILCKWILNLKDQYWFDCLILMFQKEVADRIAGEFNSKHYSRLSIISKWRLDVQKICDIKPTCFSPKPRVDSSLIFFKPKDDYYKFTLLLKRSSIKISIPV